MKNENFDFVRVSVASPEIELANPQKNAEIIFSLVQEADKKDVSLLVFPSLSLTGVSCQDLFFQKPLLDRAKKELVSLAKKTKDMSILFSVGLPLFLDKKIYFVQAWLFQGKIIAIIPDRKSSEIARTNAYRTNEYRENEYREKNRRNFHSGYSEIFLDSEQNAVPFGRLRIQDKNNTLFTLSSCFDTSLTMDFAGLSTANILAHHAFHSFDKAFVGKKEEKRISLCSISKAKNCAFLSAAPAPSESTSNFVYSAHNLIVERGEILAESYLEENELLITEIDLGLLAFKKLENNQSDNFTYYQSQDPIVQISLLENKKHKHLVRRIKKDPFIPELAKQNDIYEQILHTQSLALAKRIKHIGSEKIVLGLSGGLDSTLALIVATKTFDYLGIDLKNILAISMPGFGTTEKTKQNAQKLADLYAVHYMEISIEKAVSQHFSDIGHDGKSLDIVFENAQARERTQILMDIANKENALVLGTGNMSELALGWTTYNGDHMSMYAVNSSIPKTLVKELVRFEASRVSSQLEKADVLESILLTPMSPELLPAKDGKISQKTEDFVGPYILHDFFMYYFLRFGFSPKKIFFLAKEAFISQEIDKKNIALFSEKEILDWLRVFFKRFFSQQFKRSCAPDYPSIGSLSFSSRFWAMPSDASSAIWLSEIDEIEKSLSK